MSAGRERAGSWKQVRSRTALKKQLLCRDLGFFTSEMITQKEYKDDLRY